MAKVLRIAGRIASSINAMRRAGFRARCLAGRLSGGTAARGGSALCCAAWLEVKTACEPGDNFAAGNMGWFTGQQSLACYGLRSFPGGLWGKRDL
jgi:hypothetical protein